MTLLLGRVGDDQVREAAWVARCVGRPETAPFGEADLSALASYLTRRDAERGRVLFAARPPRGCGSSAAAPSS